ncbi:hypothetical protein SAMN04487910_1020 [Aquimarina amphilecti]|uniref:Uncharacterized protein n=2 Tax=Aquimarina amphilecti TaxID=1038014 RepID=A0A1H7JK76_AQUAM|nr:hypothetical protein SAMN04487910_1020 [Aquimarina amphilecti]
MYIGLITILFSCKSNSIAQENEKSTEEKPKVEKPRFGDVNNDNMPKPDVFAQNQVGPNTIHLTIQALEIIKNKRICDIPQEAAIKAKVTDIKGSGSGIINMISINQEIELASRKGIPKDVTYLKSKLNKDVVIIIKEKPCADFNQTVYEIVSIDYRN